MSSDRCPECEHAPCLQTEDCPGGRHFERARLRQAVYDDLVAAAMASQLSEVLSRLPRTEDRRLTGRRVTREDLAAYNARCEAAMVLHPERCFCCACLHEATSR